MFGRVWIAPLILLAGSWSAFGQAPIARGTGGVTSADGLAIELTATRRLFDPNRPIWVRFTLYNTSDEPLELPLGLIDTNPAGITLPLEVVVGTAERPALMLSYAAERVAAQVPGLEPAVLQPESAPATPQMLRLGSHGSLGIELDVREYFRMLRYPGQYTLEWSPLEGRAGSAALSFQIEVRKDAIIVTDKGKMTFALMYDQAPRNVESFLELVRSGFYDGKQIHRIIPNYLLQAGCPKGDGTGIRPDGRLLPAEFHDAPFQLGTLAMARKLSDPNSASCQFFVALGRFPDLDGQYTVIGQARDDETLRTLTTLSGEPTDAKDRPRTPVLIRSINLVDAEVGGTRRFDLQPIRPVKPTSPAPDKPLNPADVAQDNGRK